MSICQDLSLKTRWLIADTVRRQGIGDLRVEKETFLLQRYRGGSKDQIPKNDSIYVLFADPIIPHVIHDFFTFEFVFIFHAYCKVYEFR